MSWLYSYQADNNADNLPELQAFGDQPRAEPVDGRPPDVPGDALRGRRHAAHRPQRRARWPSATRTRRPSRTTTRVTFENGLKAEIAPTDHAAMLRFRFPGADRSLIFDNVDDDAASLTPRRSDDQRLVGRRAAGCRTGPRACSSTARVDQPVGRGADDARPHRLRCASAATAGPCTLRIATSFICARPGQGQPRAGDRAGRLVPRRRDARQARLGHASSTSSTSRAPTRTSSRRCTRTSTASTCTRTRRSRTQAAGTGCTRRPVHDRVGSGGARAPVRRREAVRQQRVLGHLPDRLARLRAASTPQDAGELIDGFVQQYRDGGWIARWSSPGYANLMTGTSSDVAFADAYVKGVKGFDGRDAYDAALKNATVAPPGDPWDPNVGRKGLIESLFLGYTPRPRGRGRLVGAGGLHQRLRHRQHGGGAGAHGARRRPRALPRGGRVLPQPRDQLRPHVRPARSASSRAATRAGAFKSDPADYDPLVWGHDARLHARPTAGTSPSTRRRTGRAWPTCTAAAPALAAKLDAFFATPETAKFPGSYGGTIHEMIEARDVRMGQWGFSNQVSHHIPYMYDYVGQPYKTQAKVREALRRLYVGQHDRRRATPATRTTARRRRGTCSPRSASIRCRSAASTTRSARRCSSARRSGCPAGARSSSARRATAPVTSTCRACAATAGRTTRPTSTTPT